MKKRLWFAAALAAVFGAGCAAGRGAPPGSPVLPAPPEVPAEAAAQPPVPPSAGGAWSRVLMPEPATGRFIRPDSYLRRWLAIPIPVSEEERDPAALLRREFLPEEHALDGSTPIGPEIWRPFRFSGSSLTSGNLAELFPAARVVYLTARLDSSRDWEKIKLYVSGAGCLLKVWINGELVCFYDRPVRALSEQEEISGVKLGLGWNLIVVKCVRTGEAWRFRLRFTDPDDLPLRLVEP